MKQLFKGFCELGLLFVLLILMGCGTSDPWPKTGLGAMISAPTEGKVEISKNNDKEFYAKVSGSEKKRARIYQGMIEDAKENGFSLDQDNYVDTVYSAFTSEGHKIRLKNNATLKLITIDIYAPKHMDEIIWPTSRGGSFNSSSTIDGWGEGKRKRQFIYYLFCGNK